MDTIFAPATAPGRAGVAVIRVSGPRAWHALETLSGDLPPPRQLALRTLRDANGDVLDQALVVVFEKGASFTGEESAELHCHGSRAVVAAVLRALEAIDGTRHATAGEFTRRALENGRIDLSQVEGLADLVDAETEMQRRQAMAVFGGSLTSFVGEVRGALVRAAALVEACLDFSDEDLPTGIGEQIRTALGNAEERLRREVAGQGIAERLREGFEVAIVGPPNSGKSTLLNRIAGREVSIVTEYAGTTRDVIEVRLDLGGLPVSFLDTAGIREAEDPVERIGVERAVRRAQDADMRIFLNDVGGEVSFRAGDIVTPGKADLRADGEGVSGITGQGVDELLSAVRKELSGRVAMAGVAVRERHAEAMRRALEHIGRAKALSEESECDLELVAEELRSASGALAAIVGGVDVEDLLDDIFSSFCIGK